MESEMDAKEGRADGGGEVKDDRNQTHRPDEAAVIFDGIVDANELRDAAGSAFDVMENPSRADKGTLAALSHLLESDLALAKTRGPVLLIGDGLFRFGRRRVPTPVPTTGYAGFRFKDPSAKHHLRWIFMGAQRVVSLPEYWAPTASGWAYMAWVEFHWTRDRNNVATFITVDPSTGEVSPCVHLHSVNSRLPSGDVIHQRKWEPCPGWMRPLERGKAPLFDLIPHALDGERLADQHVRFVATRETETWRKFPLRVRVPLTLECAKRIFGDRDKTAGAMTAGGRRRPIMHWTASHFRRHYDEVEVPAEPRNWMQALLWKVLPRLRPMVTERRVRKISPVRTHTRGLQSFELGGMRCSLQMPGRDTYMATERGPIMAQGDGPAIEGAGDAAIEASMSLDDSLFKPKWYQPWKTCKAA